MSRTIANNDPKDAAVRQHLEHLLSSHAFSGADRRSRLLRFLVERALQGQLEDLKESVIAVEVFERAPDYDPKLDSVVRVEMGRLRSRLLEYYSTVGKNDPVRIEIPKGRYAPDFVLAEAGQSARAVQLPPAAELSTKRRPPFWRVAIAAAVVLLLAGVFAYWRFRPSAKTPAPRSIAVLPFLNLTGNASNEYLSDSITDELTEMLAESKDLRVVARTSAFQFKGQNVDIREIGRRLNVGAVIEGSLVKAGGQYALVIQLIRTSDGYHFWSHTYDTTAADLIRTQTEIAQTTVQQLYPAAKQVLSEAARTTSNPEAHDLYMRSDYLFHQRTPESERQSLALARQAVAKDPSYAAAYYAIARDAGELSALGLMPAPEAASEARAAIDKALALVPNYSAALASKAGITYIQDWDWPQAEQQFQAAIQQASSGPAHNLYGWSLMTRGRFDEALQQLRIAEDLDPLTTGATLNRATLWIMSRKYRQARTEVQNVLQTAPKSIGALRTLEYAEVLQGDCPAARSSYENEVRLLPHSPTAGASQVFIDAWCGQPQQARPQLAALAANDASTSPYILAGLFARLNQTDEAIRYLQESAQRHEQTILYLRIDPQFDQLRNDSRYVALEKQIGLL